MVIVRDTREKAGYAFDAVRYGDVTVEDGSLATGDYSVKGLESMAEKFVIREPAAACFWSRRAAR